MSHRVRTLVQGMFALGMLVSLGFGAQQALAMPSTQSAGPVCDELKCDRGCVTSGYNYGFCLDGRCVCRTGP
jgi:hypothetical protein